MTVVLKLAGHPVRGATPEDGQYLQSIDFAAHGGRGDMVLTTDLQRALKFAGMAQAWAYWRTVPEEHPLRSSDGLPNRPLTAFNWEFETLPDVARKEAK